MKNTNLKYDWKRCPQAGRGITYIFKNNDGDRYLFVDRWDVVIKEFEDFNEAIWFAENNIKAVDRYIDIEDLTKNVYDVIFNEIKTGILDTEGLSLDEEITIFDSRFEFNYSGDSFSEACFNREIDEKLLSGFKTLTFIFVLENQMRDEYDLDNIEDNKKLANNIQLSLF